MSARVRLAQPTDAAAIAHVHVETWRAAYAGVVPDSYLVRMSEQGQAFTWRKVLTRRSKDERTVVAEVAKGEGEQQTLVGFGSYGRQRGTDLGYTGEIFTLYVLPDWQGQEIGQQLIHAIFRRLWEAGTPDCLVWVLAENPARFFYERMGGQRVAERIESFAGENLTQIAYGWPDLEAWLQQTGG